MPGISYANSYTHAEIDLISALKNPSPYARLNPYSQKNLMHLEKWQKYSKEKSQGKETLEN